jgi:hypothetical protein
MSKVKVETETSAPDTGWRCTVCLEIARCHVAGFYLCVKHFKQFSGGFHGGDKTIHQMTKEYLSEQD